MTLEPHRARALLAAAFGVLFWLLPAAAAAQDDVALTMARERFKEGVAYFDKKEFEKARVAFLQAYALKKHPAVLLNLAQSELRSGRAADAANHLAQFLREHQEATEDERDGAEVALLAAKTQVGELKLDVDTPDADVYVDGELFGRAPLPDPIYLEPGQHTIEARKDGRVVKTEVRASAATPASASLRFASAEAPAPPRRGPDPAMDEDAREQDDEVGGRQAFFPWLGQSPMAMVGVGLTGVGLASGIAFALSAESSYDAANTVAGKIEEVALRDGKSQTKGACVDPDAWLSMTPNYNDPAKRAPRVEEYERNCQKYRDNVDSGDEFKTFAIASFAVAGAAALGTAIYYIVDSSGKAPAKESARRPARFTLVPVYQSGFAGAFVSGKF
jgi:tetratricopeptide (TPR) repeat protein